MAGLGDQSTNRPAFVVHYKIIDVADRSVARLNVVPVHGLRAAKIGIDRLKAISACICFLIVRRPTLILIILFFELSGDGPVRVWESRGNIGFLPLRVLDPEDNVGGNAKGLA
jgi:hypothetical protein